MDAPKPDAKPDWLKDLQLKSWEPEILLAGIVLYGMFQVPAALDSFLFWFSNEVYSQVNAMDLLVSILKVGVYWLIVGLILHLICRGLWIGLVGLSYAFPKGIQHDKLNYKGKYLSKVQAVPPFRTIIEKLERVCSIIYSVSFLLFMVLIGTYFFFLILALIPVTIILLTIDSASANQGLQDAVNTYVLGLVIFGLIGTIDFVSMGYLRRLKLFAKIFWPFYLLFSFLTLSKYYRATYYAVATNLNRWWVFVFLLVFTVSSFFMIAGSQQGSPDRLFSNLDIWSEEQGVNALEGYYQDRNVGNPSVRAQIPSDIIKEDVLRVFIPSRIREQDSLKAFLKYDSVVEIEDEIFDLNQYFLDKVSEFYLLSIVDSTLQTELYFHERTATKQRGYIAYVNIGYLEEGLYELVVTTPYDSDSLHAVVPFYKAGK